MINVSDFRRAVAVARLCADSDPSGSGRLGITLQGLVGGGVIVAGRSPDCRLAIRLGEGQAAWAALDVSPSVLAGALGAMKGEVSLDLQGRQRSIVLDDTQCAATLSSWEGRPTAPPLAAEHLVGEVTVHDVESVRTWIRQVAFAIAPDDNRYGLNGAHLELVPGPVPGSDTIRAIATDGNRLAIAELDNVEARGSTWPTHPLPAPKDGQAPRPNDSLISRKALGTLHALLSGWGGSGPLTLRWTPLLLEASAGAIVLRTRLLQAGFPAWRHVLPKEYKRTVDLDRDALLAALRRIKWAHSWSVDAQVRAGELELTTRTVDRGSARTKVPIALEGEPIRVGFNLLLMQDALRALPPGPVRIRMGDPLSPVRIDSRVSTKAWGIVMPVRLD